jgi:hypothetical protein
VLEQRREEASRSNSEHLARVGEIDKAAAQSVRSICNGC